MKDSITTWSAITAYTAQGWRPVPLHHVDDVGACSCGRAPCGGGNKSAGKHPIHGNWSKILLSEQGLAAALQAHPQMNVGIATGAPSRFWALDVDDYAALDRLTVEWGTLGTMPFQITGSDGLHFLFAMPVDFEPTNSSGRLPGGLDVRGTGGQIVVPPSVSARGPYRATGGWTGVMPAPPWLLDLVRPAPAVYAERATPAADIPQGSADYLRATSYATAAIARECADLAHEQHARNQKAFAVACRLIELTNAGWASVEYAEGCYIAACETASGNKPDPFPESEARAVWASAAQRVGFNAAVLPASGLVGERLDFPWPAPHGSSVPAPTRGVSLETRPSRDRPFTLPDLFWEARPVLKHIQAAAHARYVSADVALYTTLVRLAAMWPHKVRLDTGVKDPASANLYAAVVGPSGIGKTSGIGVATRLLAAPAWLGGDAFADGLPIGTGEGIAEAYMGSRKVPKVDEQGLPVTLKTGEVKTEVVRAQVLHNAFMYADEGEALARLIERNGATVGEALRRAWVGETIGQSNGRAETTRIIKSGSYSFGLLVGFQPETALPLFADEGAGTPQRFLWCWAQDTSIPRHPGPSPGALRDVFPASRPLPEGMTWIVDPLGRDEVDLRPVTYDAMIREELAEEHWARAQGALTLERLDAHRPLTLVKLAALLAQLEGRRDVTLEDWSLAKLMWQISCNVRTWLIEYGHEITKKAMAAKRAAFAGDHAAAEVARLALHDARAEQAIERCAARMARRAQDEPRGTVMSRRTVLQFLAGRDRTPHGAEALARAVDRGWLATTANGSWGEQYTCGVLTL